MRGDSNAQVGNKKGASQEEAGGLVRENVVSSQDQEGGESTLNLEPSILDPN